MRLLIAVLSSWVVVAAQDPSPPVPVAVPVGKAVLQVQLDELALEVHTWRPAKWSGTRMLLVMHGILRNADEYRDHAVGMGDRFDMLVVAPKFDAERFPSRAYQRGGVVREDGTAASPAEWTYARIPQLAAWMRTATQRPDLEHWIIGHSAGGQFAMRMSAFQDTGAKAIVAANPGSALWPTKELAFGYGFAGLPAELADDARLQRYLAAPLVLYLGTADDHADDWFDDSKEAMLQGAGRHQRGLGLYWTARTVALQRGWPFGWRLVEAPGVEHDHERMFEHPNCAVALFGAAAAGSAANGGATEGAK